MDGPSEKTAAGHNQLIVPPGGDVRQVLVFLDKAGFFLYYLAVCWLFLAFTVFVFIILISPLLIQSEDRMLLGLGAAAYNVVSVLSMCHQLPMRSYFIQGVQQAVCARDVGIYLGVIAGGLFYYRKSVGFFRTKRFLLLTLIPIGLDGVTQTVLHMRESSNILRVATGLIFGFGLAFFALSRIRRLNAPAFRETTKSRLFILALTLLLVVSIVVVSKSAYMAGGLYISKAQAVESALNSTSAESAVFYVAPKTPFSLYFYTGKSDYSDYVMDDIAGMGWVEDTINAIINDSIILDQTDLLGVSTPSGHSGGIWVVVQPKDGGCMISEKPMAFCNAHGIYYYVDALTGIVFEKQVH